MRVIAADELLVVGPLGAEGKAPGDQPRPVRNEGRRRAVTEEEGGVLVVGVDDLGIGVGSQQDAALEAVGGHEGMQDRKGIDKAGTTEGKIETGAAGRQTELLVDERRGVGNVVIGVLSDDDQGFDGGWVEVLLLLQSTKGANGQIRSLLLRCLSCHRAYADLLFDEEVIDAELLFAGIVADSAAGNIVTDRFDAEHGKSPKKAEDRRERRPSEGGDVIVYFRTNSWEAKLYRKFMWSV